MHITNGGKENPDDGTNAEENPGDCPATLSEGKITLIPELSSGLVEFMTSDDLA
jgi:hypothetical protein